MSSHTCLINIKLSYRLDNVFRAHKKIEVHWPYTPGHIPVVNIYSNRKESDSNSGNADGGSPSERLKPKHRFINTNYSFLFLDVCIFLTKTRAEGRPVTSRNSSLTKIWNFHAHIIEYIYYPWSRVKGWQINAVRALFMYMNLTEPSKIRHAKSKVEERVGTVSIHEDIRAAIWTILQGVCLLHTHKINVHTT